MIVYFEVIEILYEKDPYLSLLGIDWDFENYAIINFKKETMTFEPNGTSAIQPWNPIKDQGILNLYMM
jgi:hypothetical protein